MFPYFFLEQGFQACVLCRKKTGSQLSIKYDNNRYKNRVKNTEQSIVYGPIDSVKTSKLVLYYYLSVNLFEINKSINNNDIIIML